jgi:hypothetical protein
LLTNKTKTKWNTSRSETRDEKRYGGDAVTLEEVRWRCSIEENDEEEEERRMTKRQRAMEML